MSKPILGLDMDGVCCDFVGASCKALGYAQGSVMAAWPKDRVCYLVNEVMGITLDEYWAKVDIDGVNFWSGMDPYPWFEDLWSRLNKVADVYVLSSPSWSPHAAAGKLLWLQKHISPRFDRFILTKHKHLFAAPGRFMVDDSDEMIEKFTAAGGPNAVGILFPQMWNKAMRMPDPATIVDDIVSSVVCCLDPHQIKPLND